MNSGSDGAGAGVEVTGSGRVTGAESDGRLRSVTTSELEEVEVISAAVETVETGGETVVEGLERSRKMLSLSVNKLSLELGGLCVVKSVSVRVRVVVSALSVSTGARGAGLGRTVCVSGGLGSLVVGLVVGGGGGGAGHLTKY